MTRKTKETKFVIKSVSYVNDPEAAQKWFEVFREILNAEMYKTHSNQPDNPHTLN